MSYESSDSIESLTGFYEDAIPATGMTIFSTTTVSGGAAWVFAEDEGSSFGGSVTVAPNAAGGDGATVIITVASSV